MVLNSPHNPTGKVFSANEMEAIADVVRRHPNLHVISDEVRTPQTRAAARHGTPSPFRWCRQVYKYTVYAGEGHLHFAALAGMFDRTVTLSSAGKTFSVTGWQVLHPAP